MVEILLTCVLSMSSYPPPMRWELERLLPAEAGGVEKYKGFVIYHDAEPERVVLRGRFAPGQGARVPDKCTLEVPE